MTDGLRVLVLGNRGGPETIHPLLAERLEHAGIRWTVGPAPLVAAGTAALVLEWGVGIVHWLEPDDPHAALRPAMGGAIRSAFREGIPILAPCMSFVVAVDALADLARPADVATRAGPGGLVVCHALRIIGSRRPFIGQDEDCMRAWLDAALAQVRTWHEARCALGGALP